jgi:crotonobetainyl-CoA:carnitine CoA-transferase CaiB-like acyl-CoA transferase
VIETLPLSGLRVLDFTHAAAGPYAAMFMGDLGAEVLKVERPGRGDGSRYMGEPLAGPLGSDYYLSLNRNKRSVLLDLHTGDGCELARKLASHSDIVIQNFRPGVMEKLGLGYDDLSSRRPGLIYCSISAYGASGSWRDEPANDVIMQAVSGLMSITGEVGGGPVRIGAPISDYATGLFALVGILAALHVREEHPEGQHVQASMIACSLALMSNYVPSVLGLGKQIPRLGRGHAQLVPYQGFLCSDGEYLIVGAFTNAFWRSFAIALDHEEWLTDERFASNAARVEHRAELVPALEQIFLTKSRAEWIDTLGRADVPASPVLDLYAALNTPPVMEQGLVQELDVADHRVFTIGLPVKTEEWGRPPSGAPPSMGQDTRDVLGTLLGMNAAEIADLVKRRVIGVEDSDD